MIAARKRREDPALLQGTGRFVDDIRLPRTLHAAFVRSPGAHALVRAVRTERARALPGVAGVWTVADLPAPCGTAPMPLAVPSPAIRQPLTWSPLAGEEVRYYGEPVAVVVASDRYVAEDAAALIELDLEPLPAVADVDQALAAGEPTVHAGGPDNIAARFSVGYGDVEEGFSSPATTVAMSLRTHRGGGHALEGRAVLAEPAGCGITVWSATQMPHGVKRMLVSVLGLEEHRVRVIAPPDVGGGFGPKAMAYPEEAVIPACALELGRPVKWIEDRAEHFACATQERDQHWEVELAADPDGRLRGLRGTMVHDAGAYLPWGVVVPYIGATTVPGPYHLPAYQLDVTVAFTNKVPVTPVRGAGRPQAVFAIERLLDRLARELGLDPAELRRRNLVQAHEMPYEVGLTFRDGSPVTYDSGDYPACQLAALERSDYSGFAARRARAADVGRFTGIGIANYVEGGGLGPYEGAEVRVSETGKVLVASGAAPQGQGHATTLAQVCADELGVALEDVTVITGDTDRIALGVGTFASRIAVNAGSSVALAARAVREQVIALASQLFEVDPEDLRVADGRVAVAGDPSGLATLGELAVRAAGMPGFTLGPGAAGLHATEYFTPPRATYSNGTHIAEVEVDVGTGEVEILRYHVAHDCGAVLNPPIVEGQVVGGVAHGIGNALYERAVFDEQGQPLTLSFQDYLLPVASTVPDPEIVHLESPSPLNPLGVKGAGEGGTLPAAAAVAAAVEDALSPFGVEVTETPLTPAVVLALLSRSRAWRRRVEEEA